MFLGRLRIKLNVLEKSQANCDSKLRQYRQECVFNKQFRVAHAQCSADIDPGHETDIRCWNDRITKLQEANSHGELDKLIELASNVKCSLDAMIKANHALLALTRDNSNIEEIKSQMQRCAFIG